MVIKKNLGAIEILKPRKTVIYISCIWCSRNLIRTIILKKIEEQIKNKL